MFYNPLHDFCFMRRKVQIGQKKSRVGIHKGNNKITELRTILQRENQNS